MASTPANKDDVRTRKIIDLLRQLEYVRKQLKALLDT